MVANRDEQSYIISREPRRQSQGQGDSNQGDKSSPLVHLQDEPDGQLQSPESVHQHDFQPTPEHSAAPRPEDALNERPAGSATGHRRSSPMWNTKWLHRATLTGFC